MKSFLSKTKANSRRNSRNGALRRVLLFVVIGCLVVYVLGGLIGTFTASVTTPFYVVRNWFTESPAAIPSFFRDRETLLREIATLKSERVSEGGADVTVQQLSDENSELRAVLGVTEEDQILAGVIARPPYLPYDTLLIDRGSKDGVEVGGVVYHSGDQAIGTVQRVFGTSALVALFSAPGVEVTAYVIGPDIYTTGYGEGGGVVRISVPQGITLTEGDVVLLPSLKRGILGMIDEVVSVPTQPEQYGYVVSSVPLQSLRLVTVGTRISEPVSFEEAEEVVSAFNPAPFIIDVPEDRMIHSGEGTTTNETLLEVGTSSGSVEGAGE